MMTPFSRLLVLGLLLLTLSLQAFAAVSRCARMPSTTCSACAFCTAGISFMAGMAPFNPSLVRHIDFVTLLLLHASAIVDLPERPPREILT